MTPSDADRGVPFFLSYAHAADALHPSGPAHEPNKLVHQFFADLTETVAQLIPLEVGAAPGFMDRSMGGGERWTAELLRAVGTCQVFVALLSPSYPRSAWCGMEWQAFSQRRVEKPEGGDPVTQACIIPVIWVPVPVETLPKVIRDVQLFSPEGKPNSDVALNYRREGVFGLLWMQWNDSYQEVVWRLARKIAAIYYDHAVEHCEFELDQLRNIFLEGSD